MTVRKWLTCAQVLLLLIFLCCAAYLGKYAYDLHHANNEYEELRREVAEAVDASGAYEKYDENADENTDTGGDADRAAAMLAEKNGDYAGWITVPYTSIDYPVVRTDNNDYYLKRDFYKNKSASGTPFVDCECTPDSLNTIIYAHNMKDGSMFAPLTRYTDKSFFDAHRNIIYGGEYKAFAVFRTSVGSENEFFYRGFADLTDEYAYNEYVNGIIDRAVCKSDDTPVFGDRLLTLSTCAYNSENERVVVAAYAAAG